MLDCAEILLTLSLWLTCCGMCQRGHLGRKAASEVLGSGLTHELRRILPQICRLNKNITRNYLRGHRSVIEDFIRLCSIQ